MDRTRAKSKKAQEKQARRQERSERRKPHQPDEGEPDANTTMQKEPE